MSDQEHVIESGNLMLKSLVDIVFKKSYFMAD